MPTNIDQLLIISQAGRLRDSLRVLLKSCYPLAAIEETETSASALQFRSASQQILVFLDAGLPEDQFWQTLEQIRQGSASQHCVVLAHTLEQQKQAQGAGAQVVLLDEFTMESLCAAVEAAVQG